jgi:hypothetical protein
LPRVERVDLQRGLRPLFLVGGDLMDSKSVYMKNFIIIDNAESAREFIQSLLQEVTDPTPYGCAAAPTTIHDMLRKFGVQKIWNGYKSFAALPKVWNEKVANGTMQLYGVIADKTEQTPQTVSKNMTRAVDNAYRDRIELFDEIFGGCPSVMDFCNYIMEQLHA